MIGSDNSHAQRGVIPAWYLLSLLMFLAAITACATTCAKAAPQSKTACLTIADYRQQKTLGQWELSQSPYFALSFIHSVSQTPVIDYYQINNGKITQIAERFEHHGAGLPSHISEGNNWQHKAGYFWLYMQRPIPQLIVRTDKQYRNRLHLGKPIDRKENDKIRTINLNQWDDTALWIYPDSCT